MDFILLGEVILQHPEIVKELFYFFLAYMALRNLVKKTLTQNFEKITNAIEKLTETMASLEKNHSARITTLEIKVDKLTTTNPKEGQNA